ncbi:MAG: sugar ABC transporter permease, partial [OCS116 cluster bacterium]|nr:sugar ABC transporter permease [OCS116 cluster bacterium]
MSDALPPTKSGPLQKREARLAWGLLFPTISSVALVVILPLIAIFWISIKPITLADLRTAAPTVYEKLRGDFVAGGDEGILEYRLKNSSRRQEVTNVKLADTIPAGLRILKLDERCTLNNQELTCEFGDWQAGYSEKLRLPVQVDQQFIDDEINVRASKAQISGHGVSALLNDEFTLSNFTKVFDGGEFWNVMGVTLFYTIFGTIGALFVGLLAALILNKEFKGQGVLRGLFLFPYVAPVIAVAFTWVTLFDPFSGSANALLLQMDIVDTP